MQLGEAGTQYKPSATHAVEPCTWPTAGEASRADALHASTVNHFGDLMGGLSEDSLLPPHFTPLERVVLTANGNLQRIVSSYFNAKVSVKVLHCEQRPGGPCVYDRQVELYCFDKRFCVATSVVTITDEAVQQLVASKQIGIGQLFRHLNLLPRFALLESGRSETRFWRVYDLLAPVLKCRIHEVFPSELFSLNDPNVRGL